MLNGQIKDVRSSQEPERSSIIDFVATADMRLAVAGLNGVYPILICGSAVRLMIVSAIIVLFWGWVLWSKENNFLWIQLCESYCRGRSSSWLRSETEAFKKCIQMRDRDLTLEACMVQQQPILGNPIHWTLRWAYIAQQAIKLRDTTLLPLMITCMWIGGHPAPRPFWCLGIDPSPTQWKCNGQVRNARSHILVAQSSILDFWSGKALLPIRKDCKYFMVSDGLSHRSLCLYLHSDSCLSRWRSLVSMLNRLKLAHLKALTFPAAGAQICMGKSKSQSCAAQLVSYIWSFTVHSCQSTDNPAQVTHGSCFRSLHNRAFLLGMSALDTRIQHPQLKDWSFFLIPSWQTWILCW